MFPIHGRYPQIIQIRSWFSIGTHGDLGDLGIPPHKPIVDLFMDWGPPTRRVGSGFISVGDGLIALYPVMVGYTPIETSGRD